MDHRYESFLHDMLDICSKFFKQLQESADKFKSSSNHAQGGTDDKIVKKPKKKLHDPLKEDPNAPKKPIIQPYLLYYSDVRAQRQIDHPKLQNKDITKIIADEWNKLAKDKKETFEIKARVNRGQYEKDLQEYLNKNPAMREAVEQAKSSNKKTPTSGDHPSEAPAKAKPKKVLGSSSDEDDDAQMKSPSPEKKLKTEAKGGARKKSSSSDSDSHDSDDDSD